MTDVSCTLDVVVSDPSVSGSSGESTSRATTTVAGVIVCGGRSARMGTDKALLEFGDRSLLERVVAEVRGALSEVVLACGRQERYRELGLPLALDRWEDGGPLAGIVAGMEAVSAERILVVAVDMPRVTTALFDALIERACARDLDICFFESERGIEPLCAVYGRRCLEAMRHSLEGGQRRVRAFSEESDEFAIGGLRSAELPTELRRLDLAVNLNTPEELAAEAARSRGEGSS